MISQRMCVACRSMRDKRDLLRVVHQQDQVVIDETGKMDGRGAYICKSSECIKKAIKLKSFNRAFQCNIPHQFYDVLEERFGK